MPKELTLKTNETEVLKINIGDKSYSIPLGMELTRKELAKLNKEEAVMEFFEKYLGKEVMEKLTINQIKQIITAWGEATEETSGVKLGDS